MIFIVADWLRFVHLASDGGRAEAADALIGFFEVLVVGAGQVVQVGGGQGSEPVQDGLQRLLVRW
jgi:hypothetical protein